MESELTDENVHCLGSGADNHADDNETSANDSDISTADQIREGADKWTDCCEGEKIAEDLKHISNQSGKDRGSLKTYEPNPSIQATEVTVDVGRNAACYMISTRQTSTNRSTRTKYINRNLRTGPEESHGNQGHDPPHAHLSRKCHWPQALEPSPKRRAAYRRLMIMILIIAIRSQSILLVISGMTGHTLVSMNGLDIGTDVSLLVKRSGRIRRRGRGVHIGGRVS